ncbi:hypothetical protein KEM56_001393 [Ascosphaera pollenicola]|nr:hypothetical protein KEM56_001393 [Ascosphaera pollenicola]
MAFNLARRAAFRQALRPGHLQSVRFSSTGAAEVNNNTKRDPELLVLLGVTTVALGFAGWYFGRHPVSNDARDLENVHATEAKMPWQVEGADGQAFKYQFHPQGDSTQLSAAPSALNEVVVPNVTLPADIHEKFNKYGKEDY